MSTSDDDLMGALRRSGDPADRRLADLLGGLSPVAGPQATGPRANDALASFLVGTDPVAARLTEQPVTEYGDGLVVELGRPTPRRRPMRSSTLVSLRRVLATSLIAKAALGLTVAVTGAGAVAASGALSGSSEDVVVVASDGTAEALETVEAADTVLHDFDGLAHADDVEDADEVEEPEEADDSDDAPAQPAPVVAPGTVTQQDPPAQDDDDANEPDDDADEPDDDVDEPDDDADDDTDEDDDDSDEDDDADEPEDDDTEDPDDD